ncbi:MAG: sulfur carrier protein ThiS [Caldicoprobacter oshimai]
MVEHNYRIVRSEEWQNIVLKENDNLEILKFVGGG